MSVFGPFFNLPQQVASWAAAGSEECAICQESLADPRINGGPVVLQPCFHVMHRNCWLRAAGTARGHICPECRAPVVSTLPPAPAPQPAHVNQPTLSTQLMDAIRNGRDASLVTTIIAAGANVRAKSDEALRVAASLGQVDVVRLLIGAGANVHARDDEAMRVAARLGHAPVVALLIGAGADVHASDDEALFSAASGGHTPVVAQLLVAGVDVHADDDDALYMAAFYGHAPVVAQLLAAGANIHAQNDEPLRIATENGHTEVVALLNNALARERAPRMETRRSKRRSP